MEKASSQIRRSSVRLKSLGGGNPEINMIISELKNMRSHAKALRDSQQRATHDIYNWSTKDENRALQDTFTNLLELNELWIDCQKDFLDQLQSFRYHFEMILEGEKTITQARNHLSHCEHVEAKLRKELKKQLRKGEDEDTIQTESKIAQAERSRDLAQLEVLDRIQENEAIKLIRIRSGLLKLSESYLTLSHKCIYIYEAHRDIVLNLPDVQDKDIHEIRYAGSQGAKELIARARDLIGQYKSTQHIPEIRIPKEPPPPYSPNPQFSLTPAYNPFYSESRPGPSAQPDTHRYEAIPDLPHVPMVSNQESEQDEFENLAGAIGGARIS